MAAPSGKSQTSPKQSLSMPSTAAATPTVPPPAVSTFCIEVQALLEESLSQGLQSMVEVVQVKLTSMIDALLSSHPQVPLGEHLVVALLPDIADVRKSYIPRTKDPEAYEKTNHQLQLYSILTLQMAIMRLLLRRKGNGNLDPLPKSVIQRVAQYLGDLQLRQSFALSDAEDEEQSTNQAMTTDQGAQENNPLGEPLENHCHLPSHPSNAALPFQEFITQAIYTPYKSILPITIGRLYELLGIELDDDNMQPPINSLTSGHKPPKFRRPKTLPRCHDHSIRLPPPRTLPPLVPPAPPVVDTSKSKARDCLAAAEALFSGCTVVGSRLPPPRRGSSSSSTSASMGHQVVKPTNQNPSKLLALPGPSRRILKGSFTLQPSSVPPRSTTKQAPQARHGTNFSSNGTGRPSGVRLVSDHAMDMIASPVVVGGNKAVGRMKRVRGEDQPQGKGGGPGGSRVTATRKPTLHGPALLPSCIMGTPPPRMRPSSKTAMMIQATPD